MKNIVLLFCVGVLIILLNSCNSEVVTFKDDSTPGRRDYVWTIIDSTGSDLNLSKIWGDSPDNIWISGGFAVKEEERLWHYDGAKLKAVGSWDFYPSGIFGFGKNNILSPSWENIWANYGNGWQKSFSINKAEYSSYYGLGLYDINGNITSNLWAVGTVWDETGTIEDGILYQNKGTGWTRKYITSLKNVYFAKVFPGYSENQCFIWGVRRKYQPWVDSSAVWEYDGKNLKQIHVGIMEDMENGCAMNKINGVIYITIGKKIYRYIYGKLYEYLTVTHPDFVFAVYGRNEKDLLLWGKEGLLHYNGTDVQYIYKSEWPIFILERVLTFDKEIYFCAKNENNGKYYFIKGVLPDRK